MSHSIRICAYRRLIFVTLATTLHQRWEIFQCTIIVEIFVALGSTDLVCHSIRGILIRTSVNPRQNANALCSCSRWMTGMTVLRYMFTVTVFLWFFFFSICSPKGISYMLEATEMITAGRKVLNSHIIFILSFTYLVISFTCGFSENS